MLNFLRRCTFGPESSFKCEPMRILTIWKCIRSKILDQKCIFEANLTRDTELFQTLFGPKIGPPCIVATKINPLAK